MGREYRLEYFLRKVLNCDRPQQLLSFGGIAHAGCLTGKGDFYIGVVSALARVYPMATISQCNEIDRIMDDLLTYRESRINDIDEEEYSCLYKRITTIVNTILEQ